MALKKSPLNADPDPACLFMHRTCIKMPSTAPERRQSPQERRGEGERGGRKEREARQSPGWLFLALLIVWDFSPAPSASPYPCYLHTSSTVLQELCPKVLWPEANVKEKQTSRREGRRSSAGMKGRTDVLKAEATPDQAEQPHLYENII